MAVSRRQRRLEAGKAPPEERAFAEALAVGAGAEDRLGAVDQAQRFFLMQAQRLQAGPVQQVDGAGLEQLLLLVPGQQVAQQPVGLQPIALGQEDVDQIGVDQHEAVMVLFPGIDPFRLLVPALGLEVIVVLGIQVAQVHGGAGRTQGQALGFALDEKDLVQGLGLLEIAFLPQQLGHLAPGLDLFPDSACRR